MRFICYVYGSKELFPQASRKHMGPGTMHLPTVEWVKTTIFFTVVALHHTLETPPVSVFLRQEGNVGGMTLLLPLLMVYAW